jgi:hypothetical protein
LLDGGGGLAADAGTLRAGAAFCLGLEGGEALVETLLELLDLRRARRVADPQQVHRGDGQGRHAADLRLEPGPAGKRLLPAGQRAGGRRRGRGRRLPCAAPRW